MAAANTVKLYYNDGRAVDYVLKSIKYELLDGGVALCTWNEPEKMNSFTDNLVQETFVVLEHAKRDDRVKVVVWTGAGRAWCAGAPMKGSGRTHVPRDAIAEYSARGMAWKKMQDLVLKNLTIAFWDFPKISIGAVNGLAVGGGVNSALCNYHDWILCSDQARFRYPFTKLGVTPELSSSRLIPFIVGMPKAKELLIGGEWFTAEKAAALNLVNRVVPHDELLPEALALARKIAAEPHQASPRLAKSLINSYLRAELETILDRENKAIKEALRESMKTGGSPIAKI
eukprot:TRINITY_DN43796_c0_g1_i1.p1 TRINITY_DN43796_c0_g1~~TRINITY_DN43796_c0_g1_i1.p1  ORF type:complete len:286 (+),score=109.98 TRINITY_DN43796_c0_g1_i1:64-921(+)